MIFFTKIQAKEIYFFPYFQADIFIRGGMFIHFSLSSLGVCLFGRVRLFSSLEPNVTKRLNEAKLDGWLTLKRYISYNMMNLCKYIRTNVYKSCCVKLAKKSSKVCYVSYGLLQWQQF